METYEKLYLANNVESLDLLASKDCDITKLKFQQICNALTNLYKASQRNVLDQEKTYILLCRYLTLYNHLRNTQTDKRFVEVRFGSDYKKVLMQYEETKKSLESRYKARAMVPPARTIKEKVEPAETPLHVFSSDFISCPELFSALQKSYKILLVDARPEADFKQSRIDNPNCINVPDHCITAGLSANALGKKLPEETQKVWEMRANFDVIVLFDWNTSSDNFASTKLHKLRSALVDWDLNRNYNEPPVILRGGYLELLQMYPTICINPQVYLFQKNAELDELLDLEHIEYPIESDNKTLVMGVPEETQELVKESLIEENKELTQKRQSLMTELQTKENKKNKIKELCNLENNISLTANLMETISEIDDEIDLLRTDLKNIDIKKDYVKTTFKNQFQHDLEEETQPEDVKEDVNEDESEKLKDIIDEERNKELLKARALKPRKQESAIGNNNKLRESEVPTINRANKPSIQVDDKPESGAIKISAGLVGLRNIRNTCYMSTVIQCMRNVPAIKMLFCKGGYTKYKIRHPAAIIYETANLIRYLWTKKDGSFEPYEFYDKVCQLKLNYKLGNHEDCMEFFLFLLNHLSEDCCYEGALPKVLTLRQQAWYKQFEGKNSVFMDWFYHVIRITQICSRCERKTYKFEIESTFMLSVPDHDFSVNELMDDYMADYVIPEYCCVKCKQPVNNKKEISYEPTVAVIILKRYKHNVTNGVVEFRKIESRANFQRTDFRIGSSRYILNSIAMHSGNMEFGHYTAAASTPNGWYEFNDETVRPISLNDDSLKVKACAFFYSKCDD